MKSQARKVIAGLALAGILSSGAAMAHAVESKTNFDGIANRAQQSRYFQHQNKTTSKDSQIRFSRIGGGYSMNVKAQHNTGKQYTEKKGIVAGQIRSIANGTPQGTAHSTHRHQQYLDDGNCFHRGLVQDQLITNSVGRRLSSAPH